MRIFALVALSALGAVAAPASAPQDLFSGNPSAIVDLSAREGLALVSGEWRYSDARVVPVDARAPGADLRPSGKPIKSLDVVPRAGLAGFDDSKWPVIAPESLEQRRGNGKLSFGWYPLRFTVPDRIGSTATRGGTDVF